MALYLLLFIPVCLAKCFCVHTILYRVKFLYIPLFLNVLSTFYLPSFDKLLWGLEASLINTSMMHSLRVSQDIKWLVWHNHHLDGYTRNLKIMILVQYIRRILRQIDIKVEIGLMLGQTLESCATVRSHGQWLWIMGGEIFDTLSHLTRVG